MVDKPKQARKRPKQARSRATVEAIIEASERILAAHGLDGASTTAIAELAGVSPGTLYQYFPNKESLVAAVIEAQLDADRRALAAAFERARELDSLTAALAVVGEVMARLYRDRVALYRNMVSALAEVERGAEVEALIDELIAELAALLRARAAEHDHPEPDIAAWTLVHASVALLRRAAVEHPEWIEQGRLGREFARLQAAYLGLG